LQNTRIFSCMGLTTATQNDEGSIVLALPVSISDNGLALPVSITDNGIRNRNKEHNSIGQKLIFGSISNGMSSNWRDVIFS
jgi:hypothetical protein